MSTALNFLPPNSGVSSSTIPSLGDVNIHPCDTDLLHDWMNQPRVSAFWGVSGPHETQEFFLKQSLSSKHSFPAIGCWDGKPFGYFELYWVKEDHLGRHLTGSDVNDWDRGFHALVGEQEFRGQHRVKVWASALVHFFWLCDPRTQRVLVEPRTDNVKCVSFPQACFLPSTNDKSRGANRSFDFFQPRFINYLQDVGFHKEKEISFPYKQAALMKVGRDGWCAPEL